MAGSPRFSMEAIPMSEVIETTVYRLDEQNADAEQIA